MSDLSPTFVTLGMFIIDEFSFTDEDGKSTGKKISPQIGGGGTYATIGARIWLPPNQLGMIIDKGHDFPAKVEGDLFKYGYDPWVFRQQPECRTTRAMNSYRGELRSFEYITPRIRITPKDLEGTRLAKPATLHFICSPTRALSIVSEVDETEGWFPTTIYEPIPDRCIPEELPALKHLLGSISILSPNAEEAHSLLNMPLPPTKLSIEAAAALFLSFGIGKNGEGSVIIRSGGLGAYVKSRTRETWVEAYWSMEEEEKIIDVTGAGNSFLGGLAAGLLLSGGDVFEATFYASVSASFVIEQQGLPDITSGVDDSDEFPTTWNGEIPRKRLVELQKRHKRRKD